MAAQQDGSPEDSYDPVWQFAELAGDVRDPYPMFAGIRADTPVLEVHFDGLITNGTFCCVRRVQLNLAWWHRPLRLRASSLQGDVVPAGEPDEPDLERVPSAQPEPRRRAPVGSGLSAA